MALFGKMLVNFASLALRVGATDLKHWPGLSVSSARHRIPCATSP